MNIEKLEKYCEKRDVIVQTYEKASEMLNKPVYKNFPDKGFAVASEEYDFNMICYDNRLHIEEQYLVFAHEVGHYVMGHLANRKNQRAAAEVEADVFASVLMALSAFTEMNQTAQSPVI